LIKLTFYLFFYKNRDTFVITLSNSATSIFAGFVVFAYIGHLGHITQQEIKNVVSEGNGLAFIVFPFAVSQLPGGPFWAIIFFVMMLTLGLDSEVLYKKMNK
jgi:solute carrier family 6 (neurotransmitter transporter, glycine) member 5/9